ncbi:MAG: glycosyltransferase family 39 protein, partial [Anaerolineales bacterium]
MLSLLLLGWFIRAYQIDVQEVFIDEGYHAARAVVLYDFEQHPARTANGKLGLYFWLGLFEPPYDATLRIFRLMVALPALLTGALVYRITRELDGGPGAALLALGLYMMLPFAFFFERLALADPFAAMFASAVAWRSIIFARRPNWQEGAVLGLLLAGATLAKLTMGLLPLLPVAASVLAVYQTGARGRALVAQGGQRYLLGLVVAAGVLTACWLPVFIPAGIAELNGEPFILVNPYNLEQIENADPWREAQNLVPM